TIECSISNAVDETFSLLIEWALKSHQKLGKHGVGKRMTPKVRQYLEGFFLAGNVNKTDRMTATEMVKELERLVEENEITHKEVPSIKRIENWIAVYAAGLKWEAAAE
ncbi:6380_t:CDS:1, partial [Dentiscutata heterogama]